MATASQAALYLTADEIELLTQAVETGTMDASEEEIVTMHERLENTAFLAFVSPDELAAELADDERYPGGAG